MIKTQLSPFSQESLGDELAALAVAAPLAGTALAANKAYFIPFSINETVIATGMWWYQGAAATDNIDLGIYSLAGAKLASTGALAAGTNSVVNLSPAFTNAVTLAPGKYYLAVSVAGTTIRLFGVIPLPGVEMERALGVMQMAAAHPLPATATLVKIATENFIPIFGLTTQAVM
jgi:hypothetical protein